MFKVEVLIEHPVQALDRGFSYLSKKPILTGIRVQVPFNHRQVVGYVLSVEEVDLFVLHQANARIVDAVARRLRLDIGKFPMNLQDYGNTSSASIPILLNELNREGVLKKGQKLVLAGFGAGLSWGASVLDWDITE